MTHLVLPDGSWADLIDPKELTERSARSLSRAFMKAASVAARLSELGFDDKNPQTWSAYGQLTDDEIDNLDAYQSELIFRFVSNWSFDMPVTAENGTNLPKAVFDALVEACQDAFNSTVVDTSADPDPKVTTGDSAG